jgi:hypothetical protein
LISDRNVTLFLLLGILLFASFQTLSSETGENYPVEAQTIYDVFKLAIRLEKNEFEVGEPTHMNIRLVNMGEENVTIVFTTRPNPSPYWFWCVYNETDQLVFYHKAIPRIGTLEEITLQPTEFMQHNCTWDQKATDNEQQVPSGIYYLTARVGFLYNEEEVLLETRTEICIKP